MVNPEQHTFVAPDQIAASSCSMQPLKADHLQGLSPVSLQAQQSQTPCIKLKTQKHRLVTAAADVLQQRIYTDNAHRMSHSSHTAPNPNQQHADGLRLQKRQNTVSPAAGDSPLVHRRGHAPTTATAWRQHTQCSSAQRTRLDIKHTGQHHAPLSSTRVTYDRCHQWLATYCQSRRRCAVAMLMRCCGTHALARHTATSSVPYCPTGHSCSPGLSVH